jgi:signal transduction histidine kinase
MHQLFANLISNALKFSKDHPQINITAAHVNGKEVAAYPELDHMKNYSRLTVSDNGIGFEQQFAEKVFTIFQRLNTREKYEGTGIGLALCKKIVENHQGHIHVNSEPGKGTTFTIYLPLNKTNG